MLLPFRDVAPWLDEAIAGVRAESCVERLILVDDGSTDESPHIAARHAAEDRRVDLVRTPGLGLVGALELGRRRTSAPYPARMDGDAVSLPGRIAHAVERLEQDPTLGAVGTQVEAFPDAHVAEGLRRYVAWQNEILTAREHRDSLFVEATL